ncbi:hypothetical protein Poli38472_010903 [Pythium oligandrum]|uniref:Uncharacterized protein n=1 Tax=Pythium oligandrum TaxID=41045 RepID=A0A8K1CEQ6_PYTOL|nr:hypothetical protein Poli38472_010903 [Pythium oligandrum]|eukprot:TMW61840.1 hypothetical protein Poli38472_010903 [Pythium oligandrum]
MCTPTTSAAEASTQVRTPQLKYEGSAWMQQFGGNIATYQYRVQVVGDKLQIWLRDCKADEEWQSEMVDIGTINERWSLPIPGAAITHYAKYFAHCLAAKPIAEDDLVEDEAGWGLSTPSEGLRSLELYMTIQVCGETLLPMYELDLFPVEKESELDLAAKVKAQEIEISSLLDRCSRLENELGEHKRQAEDDICILKSRMDEFQLEVRDIDELAFDERDRSYVIALADPDLSNDTVNWTAESQVAVSLALEPTTRQIQVHLDGLYLVQVVKTSRYQPNMELWVGGKMVRLLSHLDEPTIQVVHARQGELVAVRLSPLGPVNFQPQLRITVTKL